ncbi:chemotaxis protein CheX [Brevibacillus humidisoli]|uniref:chemotaxis protein CheX n=1 Tax=Brevibacillus humidisoli TaxID=2895522 RepID=UPI001E4D64DF|nr:chemotaxis protein CheX [Brevibacillus humidisoli]UFJ39114.1 chemotaxis protein CheX [Brevibacillus humidisoli]
MKTEYITPFLESAATVIEQVCNVATLRGELELKEVSLREDHVWIMVGLVGQFSGDVLFGIHREVALKIVSAMMGGFPIADLDEMGKSAISELGNMISGNASTLLYSRGVQIDISPPILVDESAPPTFSGKALSIPLTLGEMGQMEVQVLVIN